MKLPPPFPDGLGVQSFSGNREALSSALGLFDGVVNTVLSDASPNSISGFNCVSFVTLWCGVFDNLPSICGVGESVFEWVCCFGLAVVACYGVWCGVGVVG